MMRSFIFIIICLFINSLALIEINNNYKKDIGTSTLWGKTSNYSKKLIFYAFLFIVISNLTPNVMTKFTLFIIALVTNGIVINFHSIVHIIRYKNSKFIKQIFIYDAILISLVALCILKIVNYI